MFGFPRSLYRTDQVPSVCRELFINSGYRSPHSSIKQCVMSLFEVTNETVNIWTHILPAFYFTWKIVKCWQSYDFVDDPYATPLFILLLSCWGYLMASSFAHIFSAMSVLSRHVCFFMDYASLSLYSFGSAVAYRTYCLPDGAYVANYGNYYLYAAVCNAILCTVFSCLSRYLKLSPLLTTCRMMSFLFPYIYDNIPIIYRLAFCHGEDLGCQSDGLRLHFGQYFFSLLAGLAYCSHLPERIRPGTFDFIGHSHQIFHVMGAIASYLQIKATMSDSAARKSFILKHDQTIPSSQWLFALTAFLSVVNVAIIVYFGVQMYLYSLHADHKDNLQLVDQLVDGDSDLENEDDDDEDDDNSNIKQKKSL
ncbi:membrane progestin receptor gamma-like isoform X2 [Tubulanus polymorphus]